MKTRIRSILRRGGAVAMAAATLWAVSATAGSRTLSGAWGALWEAAGLGVLRWELGDLGGGESLSAAAVLTLSQSPLLLTAREEVTALRRQEEVGDEPAPQPPEVVVEEDSRLPQEGEVSSVDNGVAARTLVPTDPSGYTVCGTAYINNGTSHTLTAEELQKPFTASLAEEGPQILILHSHGSEAYTPAEDPGIVWSGDHRTTDTRYNVVRMGDAMAEVFAQAGLSVLHDRTLYDYPNYAGAYDRSLEAIEAYLEKYPSIQFILDVHRDAIADGEGNQYKVVSQVEGEGTASQLTLVMGSDGSGLAHPGWMDNLRLAVAVQQNALEISPTLMRPILLRNSRYNQHAAPGSMLVEVGAAGNAPEEAELAARLFAQAMVETIAPQG